MRRAACLLTLGLLLAPVGLLSQQPQEDLSVLGRWMRFSDAPNALYHHLADEAFAYLDARRDRVAHLNTESQWRERREEIRATLDRIRAERGEDTSGLGQLEMAYTRKIKH